MTAARTRDDRGDARREGCKDVLGHDCMPARRARDAVSRFARRRRARLDANGDARDARARGTPTRTRDARRARDETRRASDADARSTTERVNTLRRPRREDGAR
jgi:hypothetical protein